jgi:hypothetical protein
MIAAFPKLWFALFCFAFVVSILTGCVVQTRGISRDGWRAFRGRCQREPFTVYWRELSPVERVLFYPGILMFFITLVICVATKTK